MLATIGAALGLRAGEGRTLAPAFAFAFLAVGVSILASVAGDALFVTTFSLGKLSQFSIVAPLVKVAAAFAFAALARRAPGSRTDELMLVGTAGLLAATGALAARGGAPIVYGVCVALLVLPPLLPLVAFNAVAACFDARQAKRLFPLVAAAATVGTIAAGAAARGAGKWLGTSGLLASGAIACALALPLPRVLAARAREAGGDEAPKPGQKPGDKPGGGFFATILEAAGDVRAVPVVGVVVATAALGAAGMNFADYAFKAALKARYGQAEMAAYLGTFTIASNAIVLFAQLFLTSRVVSRFGVRASLGLVPASLALTGPALALAPGVASATAVRLGELCARLSIGNSVADLLLTPAPAAVRMRAKTFVKGAAGPLGALASGLALAAFGEHGPPPVAMAAMVVVTGLLGLFAVREAQRAYTTALAQAVGEGRLAFDVSASTVAVLRGELARLLREAADAGDVERAERTLAMFGERHFTLDDVAPALASPSAPIRRAAVRAAIRLTRPGDGPRLVALVPPDADAEVERDLLAAARALGAGVGEERARAARDRGKESDDAASIALWAEALVALAAHTRDPAVKELRKAALAEGSPRRAPAIEALGVLVEKRADREIVRALGADDAAVFAAAARAAVRIEAQGAVATLVAHLGSGPHVRASARALALAGPAAVAELVAALPTIRGEGAIAPTAVASARVVTGTARAARVLAHLGPEAVARVLARFGDLGYRARNAVARALATVPAETARALDPAAVGAAMELTVSYAEALCDAHPGAGSGLFARELGRRIAETGERVLDLAALVADRALVARARSALAGQRSGGAKPSAHVRGHALELLENVLPAALAARTVALLEREIAIGSGPAAAPDSRARASRPAFDGWLDKCRALDDGTLAASDPMLGVLEKVLVLGGSSLFGDLAGEELYPVAEIASAAAFEPGEVVVKEGDPGDALYVVARGRYDVVKGAAKLRTIDQGAVFGELALLDGAPRAASVVCAEAGQLLRIPRAEFEALLDESPELARGVIRTLIGHLRAKG